MLYFYCIRKKPHYDFFFLIIINTILFLNFEKISNKLDLFDTPDLSRKIHIKPIANIGGILIFLNIIIIIIYQFYTGQNKTIFFDIFPYLNINVKYGNISKQNYLF